jgi:hypothetical protein
MDGFFRQLLPEGVNFRKTVTCFVAAAAKSRPAAGAVHALNSRL